MPWIPCAPIVPVSIICTNDCEIFVISFVIFVITMFSANDWLNIPLPENETPYIVLEIFDFKPIGL